MQRNGTRILVGAFFDVRLYEKLCPWGEQPNDFVQKNITHDEAFGVPLLPPGIWKVKIDPRNDAVGTKARKGQPSVLAENSGSGGVPQALKPAIAYRSPFLSNFKTDEP